RLVPAMDEILKENAFSVSAAVEMQSVLLKESSGNADKETEKTFWEAFTKGQRNITLKGEQEIVDSIQSSAEKLWSGDPTVRESLNEDILRLTKINMEAMESKRQEAHLLGLAGAWAIGFLVIF